MDGSADAVSNAEPPEDGVPTGKPGRSAISRRRVLVYALSASTLTLVAPLGDRLARAQAGAVPRRRQRPASNVVASGADDEKLVLEVTAANKVRVQLPRAE